MKTFIFGLLITISLISCNPTARSGEPTTQAPTLQTDTPSLIPATPTFTPIPTETPRPTITPTSTPTPDPDKVWPEYPTGTAPFSSPSDTSVLEPFPEDLFGVSATEHYKSIAKPGWAYDYNQHVELIERISNGFRIKWWYTYYPDTTIEVIKTEGNWVYLMVNSIEIRARKGTLLEIVPVPIDMEKDTHSLSEISWLGWKGYIWFDPEEQKFFHQELQEDIYGTSIPNSIYQVFLYETGSVKFKPLLFTSGLSRNAYCKYYMGMMTSWKWMNSLITHDKWRDGCPIVELVKPATSSSSTGTATLFPGENGLNFEVPSGNGPEILPEFVQHFSAFPKKLYGVRGEYTGNVVLIEKNGQNYRIESKIEGTFIDLSVTGRDSQWINLTVDSVNLRSRPGTILYLTIPPKNSDNLATLNIGEITSIIFDPSEQKFLFDMTGGMPPTVIGFIISNDGKEIIFDSDESIREANCSTLLELGQVWKWEDSSIIHNPWEEGCPIVELVN